MKRQISDYEILCHVDHTLETQRRVKEILSHGETDVGTLTHSLPQVKIPLSLLEIWRGMEIMGQIVKTHEPQPPKYIPRIFYGLYASWAYDRVRYVLA